MTIAAPACLPVHVAYIEPVGSITSSMGRLSLFLEPTVLCTVEIPLEAIESLDGANMTVFAEDAMSHLVKSDETVMPK